jgi:hypothetical protein
MYQRGMANNTFQLADIANRIGEGMVRLIPVQADISGLLRQYNEILTMPVTRYPQHVAPRCDSASIQALLETLPQEPACPVESERPWGILNGYFSATQHYSWYGGFLLLAVLSAVYLWRQGAAPLLAPMAVFGANCALLLSRRLVEPRLLVSLDGLLILQVALGLSLWLRNRREAAAGKIRA